MTPSLGKFGTKVIIRCILVVIDANYITSNDEKAQNRFYLSTKSSVHVSCNSCFVSNLESSQIWDDNNCENLLWKYLSRL